MKRFLKILFLGIFTLVILMQFYPRPVKNKNPVISPGDWETMCGCENVQMCKCANENE